MVKGYKIVGLLVVFMSFVQTNYAQDLFSAVMSDDARQVKTALDAGANPNEEKLGGVQSPLHWAVAMDNPEMVMALLKHGATGEVVDQNGNNPLHNAAQGTNQSHEHQKNALKMVKALVARNKKLLNMKNRTGDTPLHSASAGFVGTEEMVRFLVEHGADYTIKNTFGKTPLDAAKQNTLNAQYNTVRIKNYLTQLPYDETKVATIKSLTHDDSNQFKALITKHGKHLATDVLGNKTPLQWAVGACSSAVIPLLFAHGAVGTEKDGLGMMPLHNAAFVDEYESAEEALRVVKALTTAKPDLINEKNSNDKTPLAYVQEAKKQPQEIADFLKTVIVPKKAEEASLQVAQKKEEVSPDIKSDVIMDTSRAEVKDVLKQPTKKHATSLHDLPDGTVVRLWSEKNKGYIQAQTFGDEGCVLENAGDVKSEYYNYYPMHFKIERQGDKVGFRLVLNDLRTNTASSWPSLGHEKLIKSNGRGKLIELRSKYFTKETEIPHHTFELIFEGSTVFIKNVSHGGFIAAGADKDLEQHDFYKDKIGTAIENIKAEDLFVLASTKDDKSKFRIDIAKIPAETQQGTFEPEEGKFHVKALQGKYDHETWTNLYNDKQEDSKVASDTISFTINNKDAYVGLFNKGTGKCEYEIVLGGWSNTKSVIRRGAGGEELETGPVKVKQPGQPNAVTIKIDFFTKVIDVRGNGLEGSLTVHVPNMKRVHYLKFGSYNDPITYADVKTEGVNDIQAKVSTPSQKEITAEFATSLNDLPAGTIIALKSLKNNKYLTVVDGKYLKANAEKAVDSATQFKIVREGDVITLQQMTGEKNNMQSPPGDYSVRFENKNFQTWEQFTIEFDGNIAFIKSRATNGYMSVRDGDKVLTKDHTGGAAKKGDWEKFSIAIISRP